jgi:iron complex outermembrane receptor protein
LAALVAYGLPVFSWAEQPRSILPPVVVTETLPSPLSPRGVVLSGEADPLPWQAQPLSSSVITQEQIRQTGSGRLTDALRFDTSVDGNYSPLGYYESFQVRGFPVDPVLGFRINGMPVVGEAPLFMGNKQQVEVLRGAAGAGSSPGAGGGLIHFVTARPESVQLMGLTAEERGTRGLWADMGTSDHQGQGWRLNLAADRLRPYAQGSDGEAGAIALAVDQTLAGGDRLAFDVEIARREQITQPGSQLLGGTAVPPLRPKTVLGLSGWSEPVRFDSVFAMAQWESLLINNWRATAKASMHRVNTDDYSSFPYGCSFAYPADPDAPIPVTVTYFCSDGSFALYDYRSINEKRTTKALSFTVTGDVSVGTMRHAMTIGWEVLDHLSTKPDYLYAYAGEGNTYLSSWSGVPSSDLGSDVFRRALRQTSLYVSDRVSIGQGTLTVNGRWVSVKDSYRADFFPGFYATVPWGSRTEEWLLPSVTYSLPLNPQQQAWASYRSDVEAGVVAPLSAANNGSVLPARRLNMVEFGTKHTMRPQLEAAAVLFHSWRPHNFRDDADLSDAAGPYLQRGRESRTGLEVSAGGKLAAGLHSQVSATYLHSDTSGLGNPAFEGKQALNIPRLRLSAFVDYRLRQFTGLSVWGGWFYVDKRPASRDNRVSVPAYDRLDLGLTYAQRQTGRGQTYRQTYRLSVENILNNQYWRDAAEFLGDAYLTPGAPRVFKLSATTTF